MSLHGEKSCRPRWVALMRSGMRKTTLNPLPLMASAITASRHHTDQRNGLINSHFTRSNAGPTQSMAEGAEGVMGERYCHRRAESKGNLYCFCFGRVLIQIGVPWKSKASRI